MALYQDSYPNRLDKFSTLVDLLRHRVQQQARSTGTPKDVMIIAGYGSDMPANQRLERAALEQNHVETAVTDSE